MKADPFEPVWDRIQQHVGHECKTKTGLLFTYKIEKDNLIPSRARWNIPKKDFRKAYDYGPISSPGKIRNEVNGPSYVWAILHDVWIASVAD
ncbi:MAG: hypothetical protein CXR31_02225 [Geobacter sp.]|nr:MAG: hypothetical protein CXR31_02225 [Geobacter sp.]